MQRSQRTLGGDFENRAVIVGSAKLRRAVKVPVGGLHKRGRRLVPVGAAALGAKRVKRGQLAGRGDLEDSAAVWRAVAAGASRHPIEVSAAGLYHPVKGVLAISAADLTDFLYQAEC